MSVNDPVPEANTRESLRHHRPRTLKAAQILLSKTSSLDCVVKDLTETGARLRIPSALHVPDEFTLSITGDGTRRPAQVVWRKISEVGVRFTD